MSDTAQNGKPSNGITAMHVLAAGGGLSTLGEVVGYSFEWLRAGSLPTPDEGQIVAITGLLISIGAVFSPIGSALMKLILAWIKKITPADQAGCP